MLVPRTQARSTVLPFIKGNAMKTASKTADKLSNIRFDIRSNKFITEPFNDLFQKKFDCSSSGGGEGMSVCDPVCGINC